jgi:hypothetical protein
VPRFVVLSIVEKLGEHVDVILMRYQSIPIYGCQFIQIRRETGLLRNMKDHVDASYQEHINVFTKLLDDNYSVPRAAWHTCNIRQLKRAQDLHSCEILPVTPKWNNRSRFGGLMAGLVSICFAENFQIFAQK